jgi:hypothetical protein
MELLSTLATDELATRVLCEVIKVSTDLKFSGDLVFYATAPPHRRERAYGDRKPEPATILSVFEQAVSQLYGDEMASLLEAPHDDLAAAVYRSGASEAVEAMILRDLRRTPVLLAKLLNLFVKLEQDGPEFSVRFQNFAALADRFNVQKITEVTSQLSLEAWSAPLEHETVKRFRNWVEEFAKNPTLEDTGKKKKT